MAAQGTIILEGVRIVLRNFAGREDQYNAEGTRTFAVVINRELADTLANDGWNVKQFKEREDAEEGEEPEFFLPIKMKFDGMRPPQIVLITSRGRKRISEDEVEMLDWVEITEADLIIRPWPWTSKATGKSGVAAYLQDLYVTIEENPLERKYADLDEQ